jgi:gas vesicle protein GvpL/GvpF
MATKRRGRGAAKRPAAKAGGKAGGKVKRPAPPAKRAVAPAKRPAAPAKRPAAPAAAERRRERREPAVAATTAALGGGKYVYCIIPTIEPLRFGAIGIGNDPSEVHTINYREIAAVVSDTPLEVYDPTRENVLAHERVNEAVMRDHTVIPMSFGTVFRTTEDTIELLRSAYDAFRDVLDKMQNKVEFGVKVLWEPQEVIRGLEKEDENLRRLSQEISSQRGSTYFARMQYGRLVDSLLQERSALLVEEIFEALRGVSLASRTNKPIGEKMILNAAFLVERAREGEFDGAVKAIGARHPVLNIRYTGPWPPYNFVNIRLRLERASGT